MFLAVAIPVRGIVRCAYPLRTLDGDSFKVRDCVSGLIRTIDLAYIDAPELFQVSEDHIPIGANSKDSLSARLKTQENLKLHIVSARGRRFRALVYTSQMVNTIQVRAGHALARPSGYLDIHFARKLKNAMSMARSQRLGMWSTTSFLSPRAFRKLEKKQRLMEIYPPYYCVPPVDKLK
mgnify:CR=1 FL=1